ncbi:CYTH domain-containing protein [Gaetbulibacter aestuarii]|uniref:CYTH domain-containing protein n=1 Tax=Gaetbulibacter aestuarii TaxID=1502358 RepID=A0ABW7MVE6_9FLAO
MIEIERKFLVNSEAFKNEAFKKTKIQQGYLNSDKDRSVRIRINEEKAFITVKGPTYNKGIQRFEWEKEIPRKDAEALILLCEDTPIEKIRYEIKSGNHIYEVDEFFNANDGLIVAEIELNAVEENFEKPDWLGKEVTGDPKYYNSELSIHPYKTWKSTNKS